MHSEGISYLMGVDTRHKTTQAAVDSMRDKIVSLRNIAGDDAYAVAVHSRFYGQSCVMHIYHRPELGERQRRDLLRTVASMEEELAQLDTASEKKRKRFARFFDIKTDHGKLSFSRNYDRIDEVSKNCGIFCILTNTTLASAELLDIYRKKDVIEKGFDDIKNHIDMKRMRVHSDATVAGKLFCAFIALIAASEMSKDLNVFNGSNKSRTLSKRAMISELEKIKVFVTPDGKRLINPLTKMQRALLDACKANNLQLNEYIANQSSNLLYVQK